jgi:hypothetical protein
MPWRRRSRRARHGAEARTRTRRAPTPAPRPRSQPPRGHGNDDHLRDIDHLGGRLVVLASWAKVPIRLGSSSAVVLGSSSAAVLGSPRAAPLGFSIVVSPGLLPS